jgi:hypothetical protein
MRPALLRAYRKTCYEADGIKVHVGRRSADMDLLLRSHRAREAVSVTAYNPFSRIMPPGWNQRMQARLRHALRRRRIECGRGTLGRWSEAHMLVFGDPAPVRRLARRFRQNGIVIVRRGQPAKLMLAC